ncbi:MAG: hypothetical protein QW727_04000 [Candidatus Pacearchaeota archaeon]
MIEYQQIKSYLSIFGNKIGNLFGQIVKSISEQGMNITEIQSKIIAIIILSILLLLIIKFVNFIQKPIKWTIAFLFVLLIISVVFSF